MDIKQDPLRVAADLDINLRMCDANVQMVETKTFSNLALI